MTKGGRARIAGVVAVLALPGLACVRLAGPEDVREKLTDQAGVVLRQETGLTVTRSGIWLARRFADEDDAPLKGLRRVEIGVYEVRGLRRGLDEPAPIDPALLPGWKPLVRVREGGEDVMVLVREKDERVRGLLVVVAERDEWVLVRLRGKLDPILEDAMELAFDEADRPELYARVRDEREKRAATAAR